jgi:outer membrane protein TolC
MFYFTIAIPLRRLAAAAVPTALAFTLLAAPVHAGETLTLAQAMSRALSANPAVAIDHYEVDKQALEKAIAAGQFLPKINLQADYTRYGDPYQVHPIRQAGVFPPFDTDITGISATITQPLYTGGRLSAARSAAANGHAAAQEKFKASGQELLLSVASVYAQALKYAHLGAGLDRRIQTLETEEQSTQRKLAAGRVAKLDLIRLQTQLSQARHDRVATRQREQDARYTLGALLNEPGPLPPLAELAPASEGLPATEAELLAAVAEKNPTLRRLTAESRAAADGVDIARADRRPQVNLTGRIRETSGSDWTFYDDQQIGVTVALPLFDGGVRRNRVGQAALARDQKERALEDAANALAAEAKQAFGGHAEARSRLEIAEQREREADEVLRIETLRYRSGGSVITDLLSAETAYWDAVASRYQAGYELVISEARLLKAKGTLGVDSFATATAPAQ